MKQISRSSPNICAAVSRKPCRVNGIISCGNACEFQSRRIGIHSPAGATHRAHDGVEHPIECFANVLGEKAKHPIAIHLQQLIVVPVMAVRFGVRETLGAVQFDRQTRIRAEQGNFDAAGGIERNG